MGIAGYLPHILCSVRSLQLSTSDFVSLFKRQVVKVILFLNKYLHRHIPALYLCYVCRPIKSGLEKHFVDCVS